MSNDLLNNPFIIDTASATAITAKRLDITYVRWVAPGAVAGNTCVMKTAAGRVLWSSVAPAANYVEAEHWETNTPLIADGLIVETLAAGTLYIGLERWVSA